MFGEPKVLLPPKMDNGELNQKKWISMEFGPKPGDDLTQCVYAVQGLVLPTLLRHVAKILANGSAAFFESCDAIGWNSCDMSQKR